MAMQFTALDSKLLAYIRSHSLHEPEVARQLRLETESLEHGSWQTSPEQAQFIALLLQIAGARRCLELGTFTGYGTLMMALALPDDGEMVTCDIDGEYANRGKPYWRQADVAEKIDLHLSPAEEVIASLLNSGRAGDFDAAFIDADKRLYPEYYEGCLELVRPGGLVLIDNVFWAGAVVDESNQRKATAAIRRLNETMARDDRVTMTMLPMGDGLTIAMKRP